MTADPLELSRRRPHLSASVPLTVVQKLLLLVCSVAAIVLLATRPWPTARAFILFATLFYLVFTLYKVMLVRFSLRRGAELKISPEQCAALVDQDLPVYSIMVPLYREPESVAHLVAALQALDYPAHKKDIQLLLEEDDALTRDAVAALSLPAGFRITLIPESHPRTKPKACNIGLAEATGAYLVIYDAEDRPESDQLRKAVAAFKEVAPNVICLQSRLNFYNPHQNLLTRIFAAEYSAWFDLSLPGLSAIDSVIPLGGTSNHFVTARLRELMGWDAYNVTEDCDLGIRICRAGYRCRMLETTTWEEACSRLSFWIPQRTRWFKGYIQTYLVHMRNPIRLLRDLGLARFLHLQALIGGVVFCVLINPLFWTLVTLWFFFRLSVLASLFQGLIFTIATLCLFLGNFALLYIGAVACYRRGYFDLVKYAILAPVYWVLMSYAGWRAFLQFFADPFRWEKTQHGLFHDTPEITP